VLLWLYSGRFDDKTETGSRRPSSQPADRSRNASDLFNDQPHDPVASDPLSDALFGMDNTHWLDMATASDSGSKKVSPTKSSAADQPVSEGNILDTSAASKQGKNCLHFYEFHSFFCFPLLA